MLVSTSFVEEELALNGLTDGVGRLVTGSGGPAGGARPPGGNLDGRVPALALRTFACPSPGGGEVSEYDADISS